MKYRCEDCNWCDEEMKILVAPNPFEPDDQVFGCPNCKSVNALVGACDVESCEEMSTCGFPTKDGYMRTCSKHYQTEKASG